MRATNTAINQAIAHALGLQHDQLMNCTGFNLRVRVGELPVLTIRQFHVKVGESSVQRFKFVPLAEGETA